jgi:CRP/FNR family transcriptional regulator
MTSEDRTRHRRGAFSDGTPLAAARVIDVSTRERKTECAQCSVREQCLPVGLAQDALRAFDTVVTSRRHVRKGDAIFHAGTPFVALYAIRLGSCKSVILTEDGRWQIVGYHMLGDIVGLDGIGTDHHTCTAIALEDSDVCAIRFDRLEKLARTFNSLQHSLHQLLSHDIGRSQSMMLTLGSMRTEERLAGFLLDLSKRYRRRGFSSTEFVLRMTREEIGSYLGMKLETVSRLLSRFQAEGLLQVQGRTVKLCDVAALRQLVGQLSRNSARQIASHCQHLTATEMGLAASGAG